MRREIDFAAAFEELTRDEARSGRGYVPMPWQRRLYRDFLVGRIPSALDLPTGLGKTSVMAIWLIARARGAKLPRRLVYVVDRRAVVDQATTEAERLLRNAQTIGVGALPISTLRGQFVDNKEWLADPAAPAIVVGTVDMVGSRLLFSGYGVSPRMRPYHAGLLGADTLVVLDEAHLVPPFQRLLQRIAGDSDAFGPKDEADRQIVPLFRLLPLSATGLSADEAPFTLSPEDRADPTVARRLSAPKKLTIDDRQGGSLPEWLAGEAWALTDRGKLPIRCLVYCDRREHAEKAKQQLDKIADGKGGPPKADTELLVGARRVKEREQVKHWLECHGFLPGSGPALERPAILFATSAGEVGVDLDADHMIGDLVAWERMVQRFGRVNRRGERGDSEIRVIDGSADEKDERRAAMLATTRRLLKRLRAVGDGRSASPAALLELRNIAEPGEITAASSPEPLRPALSRPLVDAWSMTSLEQHTGRPDVEPWLRGWVDEDRPQTVVVWRGYLPAYEGVSQRDIEDFFEAAPVDESEKLETETDRVAGWLQARARAALARRPSFIQETDETATLDPELRDTNQSDRHQGDAALSAPAAVRLQPCDIVALALSSDGVCIGRYRVGELAQEYRGNAKKEFDDRLAGKLLVLDARLRGLNGGLLDTGCEVLPETADTAPEWSRQVGFRVRPVASLDEEVANDWRFEYGLAVHRSPEGEPDGWLRVEHFKTAARKEDARSIAKPQQLADHQDWTRRRALRIAEELGLSGPPADALAVAAALHDEGKKADRWQRAFNASREFDEGGTRKIFAKTRGPINQALLDGYRHEFGSLPHVQANAEFKALSADWQDLVLHLVAAHHGFARPVITTCGCEDGPPSALEERAREVALRFARLQKRWGPWGLAWWEALLRAADAQASRDNDEGRVPPEIART